MNDQDYPVPPPPPPPHPSSASLGPAQSQSPLRRLAVQQPPRLRTTLASHSTSHLHGPLQTPASATSLSVPFSPYIASSPSLYAASPSSASPMAMRNTSSAPYNPQQWSRNGVVGGQYAPHPVAQTARVQDLTGMEGTWLLFLNIDILIESQRYRRPKQEFPSTVVFSTSLVILILSSFDAFSSPSLLAGPTQQHIANS